MLSKSFSLLFYLKKRSSYVSGKLPIYVRITIDGKRTELAAQRECEPEKWNSHTGRQKGSKEEVRVLNSYLDTLQQKIYEAQRQLVDRGSEVTIENLKNRLTGADVVVVYIIKVFQQHNDQLEALSGKDFAPGTVTRYKTSLQHTQSFIKWKFNADDLDVKILDYDFISDFEYWLKSVRNCNHNTTIKYLANFRKIVLLCVKKGWLARDPFHAFKMTKRPVDRSALTYVELDRIWKKSFHTERLSQVRDIFLFCCFTGLAYIDVYNLRRSEVVQGFDGRDWITIKRQKTDVPSKIPLLPHALEILRRYEDHPQCASQGRLLPVLSNQRMNSYLKEIADVCEITKNITFHLARHTFATTVTLTNGVPLESVSKMLGHRSIKTTEQYAKVVDVKISADMLKLSESLQKK